MEVEEQKGEELGEIGYLTRSSPGHICIRSVMTTRYQEDWKSYCVRSCCVRADHIRS